MKMNEPPVGKKRGRPLGFKRDDAVATALALFRERGYEGTSIAHLTEAIGVSATSLYGLFANKEALFEEAVELYQRTQGAFAGLALERAATAREAIRGLLLGAADAYVSDDQPGGCFVSLGVLSCAAEHREIAERMAARRIAARQAIKARLDTGRAQGELSEDADTDALADFYAATLQGLSVQARDGASSAALRKIATLALLPLDAFQNRSNALSAGSEKSLERSKIQT